MSASKLQESQLVEEAQDVEEDVRLSLRLSPAAKAALDEYVKLGGHRTIQEAMRVMIGNEVFLKRQVKDGWTILLKKGNQYRELINI